MNEYLLFEKRRVDLQNGWNCKWDIFISAYNPSDRVSRIFDLVPSKKKYWLILPEYQFESAEYPSSGNIFDQSAESELEFLNQFVRSIGGNLANKRILIDITGFITHYVLAFTAILQRTGIARCDVIYSEPERYLRSERTKFSDEVVLSVRQVGGFEGIHTTDMDEDLLILAVGYDSRLVAEVASNKEHTQKIQIFGLPSLRPDMYQENILSAARVSEAVGPDASHPSQYEYSPAHDPFVTAAVLSDLIKKHRSGNPRSNIYLSPLSTKAQALGFAVYYLRECQHTPTSIIYPYCGSYMKETSEGLSGVWLYKLEFEHLSS